MAPVADEFDCRDGDTDAVCSRPRLRGAAGGAFSHPRCPATISCCDSCCDGQELRRGSTVPVICCPSQPDPAPDHEETAIAMDGPWSPGSDRPGAA